jgi:hypothetical protein
MNVRRNLGKLSIFPLEIREKTWFYVLEQYPPTEYPVKHFLACPLPVHNTTFREEGVSLIYRHDIAFGVVDVQRPDDLSPCVAMLPNLQPHLTEEQQKHPRYGFPRHIRIHIRLPVQVLTDNSHHHTESSWYSAMQAECTAWRNALNIFSTGNLHSLYLYFDAGGLPSQPLRLDITVGTLLETFGRVDRGIPKRLMEFVQRLALGSEMNSRGQCDLTLEGNHGFVTV